MPEVTAPVVAGAPPNAPPAEVPAPRAPEPSSPRRRWTFTDSAVVLGYLLATLFITVRLWLHDDRVPRHSTGDRAFAEWNLAFAARVVSHLENPFFTNQMNMPDGINMMANTSMLGLGIPVAPLTLMFGPGFSFGLLIVLGLVGTAAAWYYVLSRHVVSSRWAAFVGGLVGGFAPSMVSHAGWHPNLTAQFLVPFIALRVIKLDEGGRWRRNGLILGALVTYQAFINEELLFFTGLGCAVFIGVWALMHRDDLRTDEGRARLRDFGKGLGVTAAFAGVLLAYPLGFQFFGPGSYHGIEPSIAALRMDVLGYLSYGSNSISHQVSVTHGGPGLAAEDNGYFGWPLIAVLAMIAVWLWRNPVVRAGTITGLFFAVCSFGPQPTWKGQPLIFPGPYALLQHLPLFDTALPTRFGMATTPLVALVLAVGVDKLAQLRPPAGESTWRMRAVSVGVAVAALIPLVPIPITVWNREPTPAFVAQGTWHDYVAEGQSVLVLPIPTFTNPMPIMWAAESGLDLPLSHGYFLGPGEGGEGTLFGPVLRPSDALFNRVLSTSRAQIATDADRTQLRADLAYWHTAVIVVWVNGVLPDQFKDTVDSLVGPGQLIGDMYVWDVRTLPT